MQKTHSFYESLFMLSFPVIPEALLFVFCFLVEMLCTTFDDGAPRVASSSFSLQDSNKLHCLRSQDTTSFQRRFCPPTLHLQPTGADTRNCLGKRSLTFLRDAQENGDDVDPLLFGYLAYRSVALLLPNRDPQYNSKATN